MEVSINKTGHRKPATRIDDLCVICSLRQFEVGADGFDDRSVDENIGAVKLGVVIVQREDMRILD